MTKTWRNHELIVTFPDIYHPGFRYSASPQPYVSPEKELLSYKKNSEGITFPERQDAILPFPSENNKTANSSLKRPDDSAFEALKPGRAHTPGFGQENHLPNL